MRLLDLDPSWRRHKVGKAPKSHGRPRPDGSMQWGGFQIDTLAKVKTLAMAQGLWFDCPKCWTAWKAGASRGPHGVMVWFHGRGVPELGTDGRPFFPDSSGRPVRWNVASGSGFDDLTLTPSILVGAPCGWHGFITNGEATTC